MRLVFLLIAALSLMASSIALAFECPARAREAKAAIASAEKAKPKPAVAGEVKAKREEAKKLVADSEKEHKEAVEKKDARLHASSARKAKFAKALAEEALTLATRM